MEPKYIKLLQWVLGVDVDGIFGPVSKAAADELLAQLRQIGRIEE